MEEQSYTMSPPAFPPVSELSTNQSSNFGEGSIAEAGSQENYTDQRIFGSQRSNTGSNGSQEIDLAALLSMPQLRLSGSPLAGPGFSAAPAAFGQNQNKNNIIGNGSNQRKSRTPPPTILKHHTKDNEHDAIPVVSRDDASVETGSTNSEQNNAGNWSSLGSIPQNKRTNTALLNSTATQRSYIRESEALWMPTDRPESAPPPPTIAAHGGKPFRQHHQTANIALLVRSLSELTAVVARHGEDLRALREESRLYARRETLHETLTAISHATREDASRTNTLLTRLEAKLDSLDRRLSKLEGTANDQQLDKSISPMPAPARDRQKHRRIDQQYSDHNQQDFSAWAPEFRPNSDFHSPLVLDDSSSFQNSLLRGSLQDHQNQQH
mmetsp:Transcript_20359/g.26391  ORF Transcript_20359/g.26391 Transcript_20359/m.26391 type:complete len:382 (-) Transcript_20359:482-1627(-)